MRLAICLLGLMLPAWGQRGFIDFAYPLPELREYLGLTSAQVAEMVRASDSYWVMTGRLTERRDALDLEIVAETGRSPLRPSELGRMHAEREAIRRQFAAASEQRARAARAVLTEAQLAKFLPLAEVLNRSRLGDDARTMGLAPPDCTATQNAFQGECWRGYTPNYSAPPDWGPRGYDDPGLVKYLGLSDAQDARIRELNRYGDALGRMFTVTKEIVEETGREPVDPEALGVRYAELEALRRGMTERRRETQGAILAVLTPTQRVKFEALQEAARLRPLIEAGRSMGLAPTRCEQVVAVNLSALSGPLFLSTYLGDCPDARALEELP